MNTNILIIIIVILLVLLVYDIIVSLIKVVKIRTILDCYDKFEGDVKFVVAILNCFLSDEQLYEFLYKANELCEKDCDEEEQEQVEMVAEVGYKDKDDESNEDL